MIFIHFLLFFLLLQYFIDDVHVKGVLIRGVSSFVLGVYYKLIHIYTEREREFQGEGQPRDQLLFNNRITDDNIEDLGM